MFDRIEIDGIEVPCDKSKLEDMRFLLLLGDIDDDELEDSEKLAAMSRLTRYLFGSERGAIVAKLAKPLQALGRGSAINDVGDALVVCKHPGVDSTYVLRQIN